MDVGLVRQVDIDQEMQQSYLDYAMSTIVARALPDARDGLKPVQRRILYGMYDMGLRIDSSYKKSARIVGEVLGKYHPHGDQAVYESMARLAQDFSMRYTLIDGQGNFGSVDGDPPAAMRYTEARLAATALELLNQLDRNTVDFVRNFDDSLNEPVVLPAAIPNLLVNGASGIAVGMATSIPPHNLTEVTDALLFMLENWEKLDDTSVSDLMKFIKGPDFPTGGIILQESESDEMLSAYATGRGKVTLRGKVHLEEMGRGKSRIIITELPYQTNKSALVERIAELAREGNIDGISDLRDESDRQGMRIVIELNKAAEESNILRELYRRTPLQTTFRISLLALVDGQPRLLALKQALRIYLEHRIDVIRKRTQFDLDKARQRAHILEGLRVALNNLDEVIQIIRRAQDVEEARTKLIKRFKLSEIQASAILEMQLRRLAALERKKIETEYKDLLALIKELEGLLKSAKKLRQVVGVELQQIKQTYGDKRRTQIVSLKAGTEARNLLTTNDLTPAQTVWVGLTEEGLIGRTMGDKLPRVSGRQAPTLVYKTNTHHTLYLVDTEGRTAAIAVQSLPETESFVEGIPVNKAAPFQGDPKIKNIFSLPARFEEGGEWTVVTVTQGGMIKKSSVSDLPGPSSQLFTLVKVNEGDAVQSVFLVNGKSDCVLATRKGMTIRFSENDVRVMGLVAAGVNGIKLSAGDEVISAFRYDEQMEMLLVAANGKAWRIPDNQLPVQGRYGQGTTTCKVGTTEIVGVLHGYPETEGLVHLGQLATKPIVINQIPLGKRQSAPKVLLQPKPGDFLAAITALVDGIMDWEPKKRRTERKPGGSTSSKILDINDEKDQPVTGIRKRVVSKKSGTEQISVDQVEQPALFPEESKRGRKPKTVKPSEQIAAAKVKSQVRSSSRGTSPNAGKAASEAPKAKAKPGLTSQSTAKDPNQPLKQRGRPKGSGAKTSSQPAKPKTSTKPKPVSKSPGRKPRPKTSKEK